MRLNPFNTSNIDVRAGGGGGGGRRAGGIGCGAIVIALLGALIFGIDPAATLSTIGGMETGSQPAQTSQMSEQEACTQNAYATETCNALDSLNTTWARVFQEQGVQGFRQPSLTFIQGGGIRTGCGAASSAMGPFYCPADQGIYLDTRFYDQLGQMAGDRGDFARLYVVAHEYGHHIQTITGIADAIRSAQAQNPRQSNQLQVLMELQADCYAGVWAGKNADKIERGDFEEGMRAAASIGDDTLQRRSGRRVNPEGFTHGTSQQRMNALKLGFQGDDRQCDAITQIR